MPEADQNRQTDIDNPAGRILFNWIVPFAATIGMAVYWDKLWVAVAGPAFAIVVHLIYSLVRKIADKTGRVPSLGLQDLTHSTFILAAGGILILMGYALGADRTTSMQNAMLRFFIFALAALTTAIVLSIGRDE